MELVRSTIKEVVGVEGTNTMPINVAERQTPITFSFDRITWV
jgi:hypothetical protein